MNRDPRSDEAIRADLAALLDELFPLDRDDEPNEADLSQGVEWWAQTCIWWAKNCRRAWADRDALLARVSELEQENERLGKWIDSYKTEQESIIGEQLARAERAEAERRAIESRWATSLDLLSERTARLWKAEDENVRLRAALAHERPELRTLDDGTDAGGYIVPPFGAIADAVSTEIRRQAGTE